MAANGGKSVVVYVNESSTPQLHPEGTKFWVTEGMLYVGNEDVGQLAVYAPGSWRRAKLLGEDERP